MFKILRRRELQDPGSLVWQIWSMKHECIKRIVATAMISRAHYFSAILADVALLFGYGLLRLEIIPI